MPVETINTLVIGGGQAGVAMSEHLSACGVPHLVLERGRIAERWRSGRWDSLVANGPAWHDRFPGMTFPNTDPDAFPPKETVADYFAAYAEKIQAPIRCGIEVTSVKRRDGGIGFVVETSDGVIEADNVVAATGPFQRPVIPPIVPETSGLMQIHSCDYRNPAQLPNGGVLVVGGGASGVQIADELNRAGKKVYISVGPHHRPPRAYRGRDYVWWLGVLGEWDREVPKEGSEHVTIAVSGAHGGETIDFRRLATQGITLVGITNSYKDGVMTFAPDLAANIAVGDENYLSVLRQADAFTDKYGLDLPEEPEAYIIDADPPCVTDPILSLDMAEAGITAIVWATGYALDYGWLKVDVFDDKGKPIHQRGVSKEPGLYFVGLPWLQKRGSSFIYGVWHDAKYLADHIFKQNKYAVYDAAARG
ncbi:NAD(P)-binding domain-containing protein [Rhodospirillaceae bacterium KN72]|uniref:NAD(P)-binding domain-containing protein n=1 Tax=Pacificispira spongiicola TaxID=2729598 RepID=A0A7Y0HD36_9PROT|nr:NAD(P)/FAD-dependent oxidoreductase [Pacificispira spongiicola]NMM43386.1 NAD(P)-binding domain-containing protein [Pacificispira spongiicola]